MKIYLKQRYRGALTNEQWIAYGEHDASELPNGLAQYLVDNGHATVIEADSKPIARQRADKTIKPDEIIADGGLVKPFTPIDDEVLNPEVSVFDELKAEYEALAGEAPPWNIKLETLRARVEELRNE